MAMFVAGAADSACEVHARRDDRFSTARFLANGAQNTLTHAPKSVLGVGCDLLRVDCASRNRI